MDVLRSPTDILELVSQRMASLESRGVIHCEHSSVATGMPAPRTKGERAFVSVAPRLWDCLYLSLRSVDSIVSLKKNN